MSPQARRPHRSRPRGAEPADGTALRRWLAGRCGRGEESEDSERGDYAIFIAVIAVALLVFGGIAYDAPRLITARQHAAHTAAEAARVAAATVAAGGTPEEAQEVAETRVAALPRLYGAATAIEALRCVGTWVEVTVRTSYVNRSALGVFRQEQPITATGAAEAQLVAPSGAPVPLGYLAECPLES